MVVSIVFACQRFMHYLLPKPFVFLTTYSFLPQFINGSDMSKAMMGDRASQISIFFLDGGKHKVTLVDLLTYKEIPLLIK